MTQPTKTELNVFLDTFKKLSRFEAEHRVTRGWGLWNEDTDKLPIPEVVKVQSWLEQYSDTLEKELVS